MSDQEPPKIEFPCDYPIKVIGKAGFAIEETVIEVMERHAPGFDRASIKHRASGQGNYKAITITITVTGTNQLEAIFIDLKGNAGVKMVL
jgi:putative lipoic acid-binding regulatory protein